MRILYGVQGTGQGHISRARAMARALEQHDIEVQWLFSGRRKEALLDMECFGNFIHRRGLSFITRGGRVSQLATIVNSKPGQFLHDVRSLDLRNYDAVITDFEPVCAWAGRRAGINTIGIGHQYAFGPNTPTAGDSWWAQQIMARFAPVTTPLGLHWHRYGSNVLPPILDLPDLPREQGEHVLVYLPFEDQERVTQLLQCLPQQQFLQYAPGLNARQMGNVTQCEPGRDAFKRHLAGSCGVICNSGFELISECLHWGKPVLTKPLLGQMEQLSNALALQQLGYATVSSDLKPRILADWLKQPLSVPALHFADVAGALAGWLADGARTEPAALVRELWNQTENIAYHLPQANQHGDNHRVAA